MTQRVFFAFPIPEEIKAKLLEPFSDLHHANIRFIAARNLHITAYFIGNADENELGKIKAEGKNIGEHFPAFALQFSGFKIIQHHGKPEMIWAAFHDDPSFEEVCLHLRSIFSSEEKKKPTPHCTLARIKQLHRLPFSLPAASAFTLHINKIELWRSHISSAGSEYEVLESWKLKTG